MTGSMVGADADALMLTARRVGRCADAIRQHRADLGSLYSSTTWTGTDAARARHDWHVVGDPGLRRTSEFLAALETRLLEQAAEQRRASASVSAPSARAAHPAPLGPATGTTSASAGPIHRPGGVGAPSPPSSHAAITGLRPSEFGAPGDGRGAVVAAMRGLADEERIGPDEIEIRALDNGRFVVVLPGVTDLSDGIDEFVDRLRDDPLGVGDAGRGAYEAWADNDEPTVRKMRYAFEAAVRDDTTVNEYAVVAASALESAGVPPGAEVMLIGHSFGAYTAMDLAADPTFNVADGADARSYHVAVTHVIAAGAETDWRFDEVPADTNALVINNRFDLVYRVEDLLHRDGDARHPGHLEQNFWGDWRGKGHDEHNYIDWLAATGNDRVATWLVGVGDRYTAGGTRVSVRVPDPNL